MGCSHQIVRISICDYFIIVCHCFRMTVWRRRLIEFWYLKISSNSTLRCRRGFEFPSAQISREILNSFSQLFISSAFSGGPTKGLSAKVGEYPAKDLSRTADWPVPAAVPEVAIDRLLSLSTFGYSTTNRRLRQSRTSLAFQLHSLLLSSHEGNVVVGISRLRDCDASFANPHQNPPVEMHT